MATPPPPLHPSAYQGDKVSDVLSQSIPLQTFIHTRGGYKHAEHHMPLFLDPFAFGAGTPQTPPSQTTKIHF